MPRAIKYINAISTMLQCQISHNEEVPGNFFSKMSTEDKELSIMELCGIFQDRERRIFGVVAQPSAAEHQRPLDVARCSSSENGEHSWLQESSDDFTSISIRETRQSRIRWAKSLPNSNTQCEDVADNEGPSKHVRTITKDSIVQGNVPKPSKAVGLTLHSNQAQPKIALKASNQGLRRKSPARRITKQHTVHANVAQQRKAEWSRYSSVKTQIFTQHANQSDQRKTQRASKLTHLQPHVLQSTHQEQRRTTQQFLTRKMTKPPLARHLDIEERGKNKGETLTHIQWNRRPGLDQQMKPGPVSGNGHVAIVMLPGRTADNNGGHQITDKPQRKARDGQKTMPSKNSRVVMMDMTQARAGRRVAIQFGNNDNDYSSRRNGLCKDTDPAQKELTFMRVLRKRF